ncbi:hypothetical protein GE21DRAFT_6765 [Neurospora crassa]|uniref:Uncharacterized protein n=1 Tax=Neurospora crassa (strain ATCC 24698 / 74-OR23-1A / CBS 708.71 / DSM 1257 / FGSC 987) TaxID=367110 RepID=Q7S838_NEUCR|nr:hypothetical protein NCU05177 [Neurospora crassa OR74A]EAA32502.1 hypothetical protein NCU05177 [Neurospora crassa OR74A]KHE79541.1 hypothetical protein GE21DRAFT_6765 [Neurospora crassa]|eukprot:XP_961738.1 hypothetical protein NCU05177 [Neurospora crassa OR74A]
MSAEPPTLQARICELENKFKTVEQLKTQIANRIQELSASEERVAKLEKRLQDVQTATVKVDGRPGSSRKCRRVLVTDWKQGFGNSPLSLTTRMSYYGTNRIIQQALTDRRRSRNTE